VQEWLRQLGFETDLTLADPNLVFRTVFTPTEAGELDFDLFLLGWRLPDPAMPAYQRSFFGSGSDTIESDGNNAVGFSDAAFDELADQFDAATDLEDARRLFWEMETVIAAQKPYIVLYAEPITEAYRSDTIEFPFTTVLGGLQAVGGAAAIVQPIR
jgi:ABC-type transport system substrate-binding protein